MILQSVALTCLLLETFPLKAQVICKQHTSVTFSFNVYISSQSSQSCALRLRESSEAACVCHKADGLICAENQSWRITLTITKPWQYCAAQHWINTWAANTQNTTWQHNKCFRNNTITVQSQNKVHCLLPSVWCMKHSSGISQELSVQHEGESAWLLSVVKSVRGGFTVTQFHRCLMKRLMMPNAFHRCLMSSTEEIHQTTAVA